MRRRSTALLLATTTALVLLALGPTGRAEAAFPGDNGRLAYSHEGAIWTVNPDGSDPRKLTTPPADREDWHPTWSPDGTEITFQRRFGCCAPAEIWVMDANGGAQRPLFVSEDEAHNEYLPAWSPDATRVTFTADWPPNEAPLGHPRKDVWTADLDGGNPFRLTHDGTGEGHKQAEVSRWSPTGEWIAFRTFIGTDEGATSTLELIRPDGTDRRLLSDTDPGLFSWSPDGSRIVYAFDDGNEGLRVVDVAAGTETPLLADGGATSPAWSPDGSQIAFATPGPFGQVHVMPATGGTPVSIGVVAQHIDWQPIPDFVPADARTSPFYSSIVWLYQQGLTTGCAPDQFCPSVPVTRQQMASFLARALNLRSSETDFFTDDTGSPHEGDINRIAQAGITFGCAPGQFCPSAGVTRQQMASFLVRGFGSLPTSTDFFTDDTGSPHEDDINRLAAAGITTGCGGTAFCPHAPVTREQMAAFLERAMTD